MIVLFFSILGVIFGILLQIKKIVLEKEYNLTLKEKIILIKNILNYDYFIELTKPYYISNINKIIENKIEESKKALEKDTILFEKKLYLRLCNDLNKLLLNNNLVFGNNYKNMEIYRVLTEKRIDNTDKKAEFILTEEFSPYQKKSKRSFYE